MSDPEVSSAVITDDGAIVKLFSGKFRARYSFARSILADFDLLQQMNPFLTFGVLFTVKFCLTMTRLLL